MNSIEEYWYQDTDKSMRIDKIKDIFTALRIELILLKWYL